MAKINKMHTQNFAYEMYGSYAAETQNRNIPMAEDLLKKAPRRVIQWIKDIHNLTKSARVVGDVMGRMHPHSGDSIYGVLVNLANNANVPLVHGDGNWGDNFNGDPAAAMRYTECMASQYLNHLLDSESDKAAIKVPNYDDTSKEYYHLLSKIPIGLLLANNNISVGKKIDIPSHNLNEIIDVSIEIIKGNYNINDKKAAKLLTAPDHRLYNCLMEVNEHEWKNILKHGKGVIKSFPIYELTDEGFKITGLPYGTNIDYAKKIVTDLSAKYNNLVADYNDLSDANGIQLEVEFKKKTGKDKILYDKYLKDFEFKASVNIPYNIILCKQISNEERSLSDGAIFRSYTTGLIDILIDFQKQRKSFKLKALDIKKSELMFQIKIEDLRLLIAADPQKFFKLITESTSTEAAIDIVSKTYNAEKEVADKVITTSTFTAYVNKSERIKNSLIKLKEELDRCQWKMENIDQYLIEELEALKDKIGFKRASEVRIVSYKGES